MTQKSEVSVDGNTKQKNPLLDVNSLSVDFDIEGGVVHALRDVSVDIRKGETLGVAGESGSGKSTLALAIVGYLESNGQVSKGSINFKDRDLLSDENYKKVRGKEIAHVAQNPGRALNPSMVIGEQIKETVMLHQNIGDKSAAMEQVYDVLKQVNIPNPTDMAERYPSELSGGQQQRALLAIGLSCNPELLILDEPTTGLDVTTQAKILDLIRDLKKELEMGILLITHNLGVIARIADRVNILYAGEMMEKGGVREVFREPANPYTQALLASTPEIGRNKDLKPIPGQIPELTDISDGCIFADRCAFVTEDCRSGSIEMASADTDHETRCIHWNKAVMDPIKAEEADDRETVSGKPILEATNLKKYYDRRTFLQKFIGSHKPVRAVDGVDLEIQEGETVGVVGESGCGKSTLGHTLLRLHKLTEGTVSFRGQDLAGMSDSELREFRSECQIIQQDPGASLNPRKSIQNIIARPLVLFTDLNKNERRTRVNELLERVNLSRNVKKKYRHELSGGQQQRVSIARAFAANPSLVVLDEPVSSLDVSVQASILRLLRELHDEYNTSYLLISHDLSLIEAICDRVAVMYLGKIVENGDIKQVFNPPYHPYTRALLSSVPTLNPDEDENRIHLEGDVPSAREPPSGCSFRTRCPQYIGEICDTQTPDLEDVQDTSHRISCHLDEGLWEENEELNTNSKTGR